MVGCPAKSLNRLELSIFLFSIAQMPDTGQYFTLDEMTMRQDKAALDAQRAGGMKEIGVVKIQGKTQAGLGVQYSR